MFNKTFLAAIVSLTIFSLMLLPFIASAGIVPCGTEKYAPGTTKEINGKMIDVGGQVSNPCTICHLFQLVDKIITFLLGTIAFPLAVVMLLYGGFMWITAAGDPGKITKGRNAIQFAVVGMIIAFAAWLIIDTILKALLSGGLGKIEGWGIWRKIPQC